MHTEVVVFDEVAKTYRSALLRRPCVVALEDISFAIDRGEVFGLLGPNRAGKSTLVKILLSICRPSAGTIVRLGRPYADRSTLAHIGYMHEKQAFPPYLTAVEILDSYGGMALLNAKERRRRIAPLLERVGLADRAREPIGRFSKGMIQRLSLAQALLSEPELLVLDEPAEGLDQLGRKLIYEVVGEQRQAGRTTLLVSHSLADIERLCDRIAVLSEGRLTFVGSIDALIGQATAPECSFEQALLECYRRRSA